MGLADLPSPIACGRYDVNLQLECAVVPGEHADPVYVAFDVSAGKWYLIVNDCHEQCSPSLNP